MYIYIYIYIYFPDSDELSGKSWNMYLGRVLFCLRCNVFSSRQEKWIGTSQHSNLRFVQTTCAGVATLFLLHSDSGCAEWSHSVTTHTHTHTHWHLLGGEMTSICSHCSLPFFCHILVECQFYYNQCSRCHLQFTSRNVPGSNCYCVFPRSWPSVGFAKSLWFPISYRRCNWLPFTSQNYVLLLYILGN